MNDTVLGKWILAACVSCVMGAVSSLVAMFTALHLRADITTRFDLIEAKLNQQPISDTESNCTRSANVGWFGLGKTYTEVGCDERN